MGDNDKQEGDGNEGKGRRITIKMDGSMITALVALLTAGGLGIYNTGGIGELEMRDTRDGVTIQVNEAYKKAATRDQKLARAFKRHRREVAELYEVADWMALALAEMGKKHPATWRKVRRTAPAYVTIMMDELGSIEAFDDTPPSASHMLPLPARYGGGGEEIDSGGSDADFISESDESIDDSVDSLLDDVASDPEPIDFPDIQQIRRSQKASPNP